MKQLADNAAIATSLTSPAWATWLAQINMVLTFVSLVLGIAFVVWRWWKSTK